MEEVTKRLIEEAKIMYPKGTVYKSAMSGHKYTISGKFTSNKEGDIFDNGMCVYIHHGKGRWAEIERLAKPEIINDYPIF